METGRRGFGLLRGFREFMGPLLHRATADLMMACAGADLILFAGPTFFAAYNVAGGLLWIASLTLGGYAFGNIPIVRENFSLVVLAIIGVSILPGVIEFARQRRKHLA